MVRTSGLDLRRLLFLQRNGRDAFHFDGWRTRRYAFPIRDLLRKDVIFPRLRNSPRNEPCRGISEDFKSRATPSTGYMCVTRKATPCRDPLCKLCLRPTKCVHSHLEIIMAVTVRSWSQNSSNDTLCANSNSYHFTQERELIRQSKSSAWLMIRWRKSVIVVSDIGVSHTIV